MDKPTRTPNDVWNNVKVKDEEGHLIVRQNYICTGVLDKSQLGDGQSFGLVHAVYELYGPHACNTLITALGQLFTVFLQKHGFTARIGDLVVNENSEVLRKRLIEKSYSDGITACAHGVGMTQFDPLHNTLTDVSKYVQSFILSDQANESRLDGIVKGTLHGLHNSIMQTCFPYGTKTPFPLNHFQLMILTGAKGSTVNMAQIVASLGQQELEGKRVPRMNSGKTLPSFTSYDPSPRAGGFVTDRFLTGLKPEEYFFHCMAGREGLVDTAVKTSRSGYLQRCLIKGLETLHVAYDNTVRDCDQNIIQFLYGEDSLDVTKSSYLDSCKNVFEFFTNNQQILQQTLLGKTTKKQFKHFMKPARSELENWWKWHINPKSNPWEGPMLSTMNPAAKCGITSEPFYIKIRDFCYYNPKNSFVSILQTKQNKSLKQKYNRGI
ncbi:RNA polymerase I, largest subunit [Reticulomyxa filosa]|uniref:DNA-directed RNA polymerase n=1 Tax=Reticulomyxa filosa TaxID=46433 RepID=X6P7B7_RETFI|nr:RNA polymerase I, largest subunit [Reticulomyxa filosa]|eukprot:ETO34013.1 RNA polymerase I, largest subunit [Reticulomyxa filosa]